VFGELLQQSSAQHLEAEFSSKLEICLQPGLIHLYFHFSLKVQFELFSKVPWGYLLVFLGSPALVQDFPQAITNPLILGESVGWQSSQVLPGNLKEAVFW
jgi:hypothetical protein